MYKSVYLVSNKLWFVNLTGFNYCLSKWSRVALFAYSFNYVSTFANDKPWKYIISAKIKLFWSYEHTSSRSLLLTLHAECDTGRNGKLLSEQVIL